ncbi:ABC transporter permease [Kitasatospora sp. NBC_01287]|uniref:ABC transporter permease n=1 Tax=Kitasatospora sp. NBC_01287 TaxID=2903573 RepID=UPI002251AE43|nr:ABC transporter permease [Kitasatospora sp. NBC_01287]MCX4751617.1 ABC transporter permease [Kitasatospora sp. NBC_01287]
MSRRFGLWAGLAVLAVLAAMALAPALFTGTDPNATDLGALLRAPSGAHLLGTDQNGRDLYARIVYGARPSLLIGTGAVALALVGGTVLGVAAAQGGRLVDQLLGRLLDVLLSVPGLLLVFLVVAVLGPGSGPATLGLAIVSLPGFARVARAEVIGLRNRPYIEAAHGFGRRRIEVVARHVLPNALGPVLALGVVSLGATIVAGSSLSFVGLGPRPPTAEWGAMLAGSREFLGIAWWTAAFPGAAVTAAVLAVSVVGRHLQQTLDRRQR